MFPCSTLRVHLSLPSVGYIGGSLCQFDIQHHLLSQPFFMSKLFAAMLYFDVLAVISTVVSRSKINSSQFDPQTFTWFDCTIVDSSRTLSYLVRRFRCKPSLHIRSRSSIGSCSSGSSQQFQLVLFDMVELSRSTVRSPA